MILNEIAERTVKRINEEKKALPLTEVRRLAEELPVSDEFPFYNALKMDGISFICEVKKASPSKGIIAEDFP
ncbi:MAG: indole-3-glycerol phosphate synthase, partial [Lachnospiraceae bacterium]|nr:indole-3-glycerol phosphate synthase [Lachnospiraceae bacterium]